MSGATRKVSRADMGGRTERQEKPFLQIVVTMSCGKEPKKTG